MSKVQHTPEPWEVTCGDDERDWVRFFPFIEAKEYTVVGNEGMYGEREIDLANARRIVAAVNACEGISTEALEDGVVKEMREALEFFINICDTGSPIDLPNLIYEACVKAKSVSNKAKGE